ncbi:hypothetical protein L2712_18975 [Shewanella marisflavi]|nr:hypothetical protein [Shewanella marisflavi]
MNNPLAGTDPTGYAADYINGVTFGASANLSSGQVELLSSADSCSFCTGEFASGVDVGSQLQSNYATTGSISSAVLGVGLAKASNAKPRKKNGANNSVKSDKASDIGADSNSKTGIVYERTNPNTGECYIGQCKSPERFEKRKKEHDKKLGVEHKYKIVDRAEPGDALDAAEHNKIQDKTAGMRAKDSDAVQNKKDPVGPARRPKMGIPEPKRASGDKAASGGNKSVKGVVRVTQFKTQKNG